MTSARMEYYCLAAIVVLGAGLRFALLGSQSLWGDELASVAFARMPVAQLWSTWMVHETNPPLYYTLLHYWIQAFGDGEFAVRAPSAIIGAAAVPGAYFLGRKIASSTVGLWSAGLMAIGGLQLGFSQEARGYILAGTAALFATLALCDISDQIASRATPRRYLPWFIYIAAVVIALYTHTTMVLLLLAANLYAAWLWGFRSERRLKPALMWIGANALCVALWLWWGWITTLQLTQAIDNASWIGKPTLLSIGMTLTRLYGVQSLTYLARDEFAWSAGLALLNAAAAGLLFLVAAHGLRRMHHPIRYLLALIAVGVPLMYIGLSEWKPIFTLRTVFWVQYAFLVLLAAGVAGLPSARLKAVAGCLIAALFLFDCRWELTKQREPWRGAVQAMQSGWRDGDVILVADPAAGFGIEYYCERMGWRPPILAVDDPGGRWAAGVFDGRIVDERALKGAAGRYRRIWLVADHGRSAAEAAAPFAHKEFDIQLPISLVYGDFRLSLWRVGR